MAAMSEKTKRVYSLIKGQVEYARKVGYEKWLGKTPDSVEMRQHYDEICGGTIHTLVDGRSLAALERRGLIRYVDDMRNDCWRVTLVEE